MFKKRSEIKKAHHYLQLYGPYCIFYIKKTKSPLEHTQARLAPQLLGNFLSLMLTTAKPHWQTMLPWANHLTSEPPFPPLWNGTKSSTSTTECETRWKLKALEVLRSPRKESTATRQQQLPRRRETSHLLHFKS